MTDDQPRVSVARDKYVEMDAAIAAVWDAVRGDARAKSAVTAVETLIAQRDQARQEAENLRHSYPISGGDLADEALRAQQRRHMETALEFLEGAVGHPIGLMDGIEEIVRQREDARYEALRWQTEVKIREAADAAQAGRYVPATLTAAEALDLVAEYANATGLNTVHGIIGYVAGLRAGIGGDQ